MNLANDHLAEERLIAAVLAEEDLSQGEIDHLALCPYCRALRDGIASDLIGLEDLSRQAVQVPPRRFRLPAEPQARSERNRSSLIFGGSLALAAAALVAVWLGVWGPQATPPQATAPGALNAPEPAQSHAALPEDSLSEYAGIVNPLEVPEAETFSPFQQFVLGGDREASSEEFMDFIMPEPGPNGRGKKGGAACLSIALPA